MRFNGKELAALALQPSHKFDKEGVLIVREKQEGLFRRSEVSTERWCRLRGNMLFYFKSRDPYSEPAGVIVLEQYSVQLESSSEEGPFSFVIVFDGDCGLVQLCANSEGERDAWIQALHMASYEYMRSQLKALNEKLEEKKDGEKNTSEFACKDREIFVDLLEEPYIEMSLACDNLLCDGDGQPPNPIVFVSLMQQMQWISYAQSEIIRRSSNPCFLTTINFRLSDVQGSGAKIKLSVYDVRERLTATMTILGSAVFPFDGLVSGEQNTFRLALISGDGASVGFVTVTVWYIAPESIVDGCTVVENMVVTRNLPPELVDRLKPCSYSSTLAQKLRSKQSGNLNLFFENVSSQTYRFHTGLGADLSVHEIMAESRLCFTFPQSLVKLFIKEEKELLHFLTSMGELKEEWSKKQSDLIERHLHLINTYTVALQHMDSYSGSSFKPSSEKNSQELEFVPVNLHLQRIWIHNDSIKKSGTYDVFTVGAFSAHSRRFRHGGLYRILNQMKQSSDPKNDKAMIAAEAVARIKQFKSILENLIDELVQLAAKKNSSRMCMTMTDISTKAHHLIGICETSLVEEASAQLDEISVPKMAKNVNSSDGVSDANLREIKGSLRHLSRVKERSKSLDGTQLLFSPEQLLSLEKLSRDGKVVIQETNNRTVTNKQKREFGSPKTVRRRMICMTRHGSLKEGIVLRANGSQLNKSATKATDILSRNHSQVSRSDNCLSTASKLVLVNNAKNEGGPVKVATVGVEMQDDVRQCNRSRSPEETEPWDLTQLNIEASIMCMASKVKSLCRHGTKSPDAADGKMEGTDWVRELMPSIRKLLQALECLWRTANLTHATYLLMEPLHASIQLGAVQHRRDIIFAHILTSLVVALVTRLWCQQVDTHFVTRLCKVGLLAQFEGLLSCHGDEMGMLEDMVVAIEDVQRVTFRTRPTAGSLDPPMPVVEGCRLLMTVHVPIPETLLGRLSPEMARGFSFHITPVFFNIGINEQATIAERETCSPSCMHSVPMSARKSIMCMHNAAPNPNRFGDLSLQDKINSDGLDRLTEFYSRYRQVTVAATDRSRRPSMCESAASVSQLLDKLSSHVHSRKGKNVEILQSAAQICRMLNGLRFTSCKSAKDRTSMSVTLEQCIVLQEQFDLAEHEFNRALECMRCEGTRRENTFKNAGVKKYAFNALQLMALPKRYRPPAGTYGNVQT